MNNKRMMVWAIMLPIIGGVLGYSMNPVHQKNAPKAPPAPAAVAPTRPAPAPLPAGPKPTVASNVDLAAWSFDAPAGGEQRALSHWAGKTIVLNFWATWCTPCIKEMPAFVDLQKRYEAQGVQFIGLALDDAASVGTFAKAHGITYPLLIGDDPAVELLRQLGNVVGAIPFTAVIDRGGRVVKTHPGEWAATELEDVLRTLL